MTYTALVLKAAKMAKISAILLFSICAHESRNFSLDYSIYDNGSPSYGVCQIKKDTATMLGWKGNNEMELRNPVVSTKYAALYLKYQQERYGENDWVKLVSGYNAGSYLESKKRPGCPKNMKYVKLVQQKLPENLKYKLNCVGN